MVDVDSVYVDKLVADIQHHGIKGMRWGVRQRVQSTGEPNARQQRKEDKAYAKASRKRAKGWSKMYDRRGEMSNQEISTAVSRLRLENEFQRQVQTAQAQSARRSKGRQYIQQVGRMKVPTQNGNRELTGLVASALVAAGTTAYKKHKQNS